MNQKITLYSNGCPKCKVLKSKLCAKNIQFIETDEFDELEDLGIKTLPVLKIENEDSSEQDTKFMNFLDANNWINNQGEIN